MTLTTIPIEKDMRNKLREIAKKSESWNDLMQRLYDNALATQHAEIFFASKTYSADEMINRIEQW